MTVRNTISLTHFACYKVHQYYVIAKITLLHEWSNIAIEITIDDWQTIPARKLGHKNESFTSIKKYDTYMPEL